ncbi:4-(cytidine 5'-diphospho)-2-C-methyl-D-erythritol kinase [Feifania hominis]|uniref:4-diphosphocytidyl-2-C-methyl-D-erythritol kinase n=1 Tax=Feifania hominis TaxID=2763660 RepID=A0A926DC01_9FIRM|nr:4-(cytidine 5'-diphospho)-2-C-methyl-D-erythritol kinase [Feifania hominis]MBC8535303.1 4-(cytidine 5'-diphospho)-2-C-methyl-D-erythritol kinase [Feifania hominis]
MRTVSCKTYAKINLTLDVRGKNDDGYHEVEMVMQSVSLHDDLTVRLDTRGRCADSIRIRCNLPYVPRDERNTAYKAALLFFEQTGIENTGLFIDIVKRVPVAAGLAGGSANAAGVLHCLNRLCGRPLGRRELAELALRVGADVPFCLTGGTCVASGIGERLTPAPPMPRCHILIAKPPKSVKTREIYEAIDRCEIVRRPDTAAMLAALKSSDAAQVAQQCCNVMEEVTSARVPEILELERTFLRHGALCAVMSGSGPSVFGIFTDFEAAARARDEVKRRMRRTLCFLERPVQKFSPMG